MSKKKTKKFKHIYFNDNDYSRNKQEDETVKIKFYPHISDFEVRFGHSAFEYILVMISLTLLGALIFYLIKPNSQFADIRNTTRATDLVQIRDAISQFEIEQGTLSDLTGDTYPQCPDFVEIGTGDGRLDIGSYFVDEYLLFVPNDPSKGTHEATGYTYCEMSNNHFRLDAVYAELDKTIAVIR